MINWTREVMKSSLENTFFYKAVENTWSNCSSSFSEISVYKSHMDPLGLDNRHTALLHFIAKALFTLLSWWHWHTILIPDS